MMGSMRTFVTDWRDWRTDGQTEAILKDQGLVQKFDPPSLEGHQESNELISATQKKSKNFQPYYPLKGRKSDFREPHESVDT